MQEDNRHETIRKRKRGRPRTMWTDVKIVALERKMADDRILWGKTIRDHSDDPR